MQVTWSNSLGSSGTASGAATWSADNIGLFNGTNTITVTARDAAGNTGTGSIVVTYNSGSSVYEGFGGNVTGGVGGTVVTVANLNNSGTGSLREALGGSNRIVQFATAGTINLTSPITVTGTNVTIDGFSAPAPGITITSSSNAFVISGNSSWPDTRGSNIIVRGLRFRNVAEDAIQIAYNAHDIVVDHNSFAASGDGEVDVTEGAYNVTISNNIFSNNNGPGASLLAFDAARVSYHHNLFYGNNARNPKMDASFTRNYSSGPQHTGTLADYRYNIIWNYQIGTYMFSDSSATSQANVVSNLYKSSGVSNPSNVIVRDSYGSAPQGDAYVQGNITVHDCRGNAYSESHGSFPYPSTNSMNNHAEFPAPAITGPSPTDQQGRLDEWLAVRNGAGVISKYADDTNDLEVRTAIVVPDLGVFSTAWND
jgi:pectate lyase